MYIRGKSYPFISPIAFSPKFDSNSGATDIIVHQRWADNPRELYTETILHANNIPITSFNKELYRRGFLIRDRRIAFDMDSTLLDFLSVQKSDEFIVQVIQPKPGMEAFMLGLARHNELMLYSVTAANRLLEIMKRIPAMQLALLGEDRGQNLSLDAVIASPRIFCTDHAVDALEELTNRALMEKVELDPIESRLIDLYRGHGEDGEKLIHVKSRHMSTSAGKAQFDILVDDSNTVSGFFLVLEEGFQLLTLPDRGCARSERQLDDLVDDMMLQVAKELSEPSRYMLFPIGVTKPMPRNSTRRFEIGFTTNEFKTMTARLLGQIERLLK